MGTTIHDIAKIAGVNPSTVSRALRGDPRVREKTREMIQRIADETGYVVNLSARNLAAGSTRVICLVMGSITEKLEYTPAAAMTEIFSSRGYTVMILLRGKNAPLDVSVTKLAEGICDGAVIFSPPVSTKDTSLSSLSKLRQPVIFFDQWLDGVNIPVVTTNVGQSIDRLMEKVCACGIDSAFVAFEPGKNIVAKQRFEWAKKRLSEKKIPCFSDGDSLRSAVKAGKVKKLAVFADSPQSMTPLPVIPGVEYIGAMFDSWELNYPRHYSRIFLCVQDFEKMGTICAEKLLGMIDGEKPEDSIIAVPPKGTLEVS